MFNKLMTFGKAFQTFAIVETRGLVLNQPE